MTPAVVGFRAHSGWAACVAIAGSVKSPYPIDRRRIELISKGTPKQPYHAAEKLSLVEAAQLIDYSVEDARRLAVEGLGAVKRKLASEGFSLRKVALLTGSGRSTSDLAAVMASHALIHTAEGELFREALAFASQEAGLSLERVREKTIFEVAEARLRVPQTELQSALIEMGKALGPPWTQDQKQSALAAWLSLAVLT